MAGVSWWDSAARPRGGPCLLRSTIDLAHQLGLRVVAEAVESQATWNKLRELGCDIAQGYLVGRPIPASQFIAGLSAASEFAYVA